VIYGKEIAPKTKTPHLQGYAELEHLTKFTTIKKALGDRYHIESRKGAQRQAIDYCKKDGKWTEVGTPRKQGARTDIPWARQLALEEGMREVTARCNMQDIRIAEKFLTYNEEPRDWKPKVIWIWGKTGTGKSRRARETEWKPTETYTKNDGTKWWDGYDAHECVILDDFRCSWWTITEMLSLLDRYEKKVEYKGGWRQFKPKCIIITSCQAPSDCYKNTGEAIDQLIRRVDEIIHLVSEVSEVGEGNTILPLPNKYEDNIA